MMILPDTDVQFGYATHSPRPLWGPAYVTSLLFFFADAPWKLAMTLPFFYLLFRLPSMSTDCPYADLVLFEKVSFCDFSQYSFSYVGSYTVVKMMPPEKAGRDAATSLEKQLQSDTLTLPFH